MAKLGDQFCTDALAQSAHPSLAESEGAMDDSQRYRDNAAECLLAAQEACEPSCRKLLLTMAVSWLSLVRQDEDRWPAVIAARAELEAELRRLSV